MTGLARARTNPSGASAPDDVILRRVATQDEYDVCVDMQYAIWGDEFVEAVPGAILRVAQYVGGVTAGAFDQSGKLLGFVFGITGVMDGRLVHWSDLLAVRPEVRNRGLGRQLKLYQRELLRPLGVETMFWTFDPLVAKNAYLNLVRLGAQPAEYVVDMYGSRPPAALQGAFGTDRFIVAWRLADQPGTPAGELDRAPWHRGPITPPARRSSATPAPSAGAGLPDAPVVRVEIPSDITRVIAEHPDAVRRWRETTRRAFTWYLGRGYRVTSFSRDTSNDRCHYTLTAPSA